MRDDFTDLLRGLDGVRQDPRWHPEGDALYHSLQVFARARAESEDPALWAAALLHDVGKALGGADHDERGADLLEGLVSPRVVFLVRHHLDLLRQPGVARRRLRGTRALADLEKLRRWDVLGRDPRATAPSIDDALEMLFQNPGAFAPDARDDREARG